VSGCKVSRMRTQGPNLGVKAIGGEPTLSEKINVVLCACDKDEYEFDGDEYDWMNSGK